MADVMIFHNPHCGSSNNAVQIARELGTTFDTVEYLKAKPTRETLEGIIAKLEDPVADLVRKDALFAKLGLSADDYTAPEAVIELLLAQPKLLQRPLVITPSVAIIGRPKERVRALLASS